MLDANRYSFGSAAERTAAAPGVKEYLATSTSMSLTLLDVDKKK